MKYKFKNRDKARKWIFEEFGKEVAEDWNYVNHSGKIKISVIGPVLINNKEVEYLY